MIANKLDPSLFPYVKDPGASAPSPTKTSSAAPPTSLRNKATWTKAGARPAAGGRADNRQRVFVFVAGGMTYSEIRCAYEISASTPKDVYIGASSSSSNLAILLINENDSKGSTHTLIPEEFIEDLKTLDGGAGQSSKSASSSLPEDRSAQTRPFQVYYDQRYYTKDEPPPPPKPTPNLAPPSNANSSSRPSVSSANSGTSMGRSNSPAPGFGSGAASETDKKDKAKKKRFLGF
ncbi:vacuolar sorting protein VPS33/slp1 [Serendipita sp. 407]|nr:vacuolar sorting protein VPS33/slp1 [Serendipita sp. 407]